MSFENRADQDHTVERCWEWYHLQREASQRLLDAIRGALTNGQPAGVGQFHGMTPKEFNTAANWHLQELEHLAAMNMFSAAEAGLLRDYRRKGRGKESTAIARAMRALYLQEGFGLYDLSLVLNVWCSHTVRPQRDHFSAFKGALHYRHWLAHGRRWILLGERYTLAKVLDICTNITAELKS